MLFQPEAHEALTDEPWGADKARRRTGSSTGRPAPGCGSTRTATARSARSGATARRGSCAHLLDEDLANGGGELVWRSGPLRKGANLCHGTAGNGYTFLALLERLEDEQWLARARAFAMHAAVQAEQSRTEYGRGRYSLWTGDIGTALYLADCVDGAGKLPLP